MFTQSFLLIAAFTTTLNALYEDCDHYGSTPIGFCDVGIELNCEQTVSGEWNLHRTEFAKADCSGDVINETILDIPEHAYHCGSGECAVEDLMIIEVGHENAAGLCSDFTASMLIQNECISGLYITANPTLQAVKLFCNEIEQTISYLSWDNDDCAGDSLQQNEVLLIDVDEIQDRYNTSDLCIELICHEADSGESSDDTTYAPTDVPTAQPTLKPTSRPTDAPTRKPTKRPTSRPTDAPTRKPTERPTSRPTDDLSDNSGSSSNDNSGSSSSRSSSRNKGWRESVSSSSSDYDTRSWSRSGSNGWRKNRKSRNRSNGRRKYRKSNRNNRSS